MELEHDRFVVGCKTGPGVTAVDRGHAHVMKRRRLRIVSFVLMLLLVGQLWGPVATALLPPVLPPEEPSPDPEPSYPPLPEDSGTGRRIVYAVSEQRVWIVEGDESVSGSWLVSGRAGTPEPGTYSIYSRSRWASSENGRARMEFMLRFVRTRGLPIGFHAIPVDRNGRPVQSEEELGQPRSKGCVRQRRADAEHLWNWAPNGTTVRVTA